MKLGKRALITGAGGGIGRAVAIRLASEGCDIALLDFNRSSVERLATELEALGCRLTVVCCDVSDALSLSECITAAADYLGGLDSVVTCAGVSLQGEIAETSLEMWNLSMGVNLTGTFLTIKYSLPFLEAAGGGSIVTLGSLTSLVAGGRSASYDASKGGVLQLTRAVAVEWAERGVRANCVCPGGTETELRSNSLEFAQQRSVFAPSKSGRLRVEAPMGRSAAAREIAGVVAFLCSDDASFMTGAAVPVDGGYTAI